MSSHLFVYRTAFYKYPTTELIIVSCLWLCFSALDSINSAASPVFLHSCVHVLPLGELYLTHCCVVLNGCQWIFLSIATCTDWVWQIMHQFTVWEWNEGAVPFYRFAAFPHVLLLAPDVSGFVALCVARTWIKCLCHSCVVAHEDFS